METSPRSHNKVKVKAKAESRNLGSSPQNHHELCLLLKVTYVPHISYKTRDRMRHLSVTFFLTFKS